MKEEQAESLVSIPCKSMQFPPNNKSVNERERERERERFRDSEIQQWWASMTVVLQQRCPTNGPSYQFVREETIASHDEELWTLCHEYEVRITSFAALGFHGCFFSLPVCLCVCVSRLR